MDKSKLLKWSKGPGPAAVFLLLAGAGVGIGFSQNDLTTFGIAGGVAGLIGAVAVHFLLKSKANANLRKQAETIASESRGLLDQLLPRPIE